MSNLIQMPIFDSINQSNMSSSDKTQLSRILTELSQPITPIVPQASRGEMVMQTLLSSLVGGGLGLLHAELKEGLDVNGIPVDLVLASLTGVGGIIYRSEKSVEIAKSALTVYSFRTTESVLSGIKERRAKAAQAA